MVVLFLSLLRATSSFLRIVSTFHFLYAVSSFVFCVVSVQAMVASVDVGAARHQVRLALARERNAKKARDVARASLKRHREEVDESRPPTPRCVDCSTEYSTIFAVIPLCRNVSYYCIGCYGKRVELTADRQHLVRVS